MYCGQCGFNVGDGQQFCTACGSRMPVPQKTQDYGNVGETVSYQPASQHNTPVTVNTYFATAPASSRERNSFWWGMLCLIFPFMGLVLYFSWKHQYPKTAKVCLWCGIISFIANVAWMSGAA